MGNRIVVADVQESFHFIRYKRAENQLIIFADDTNSRWITSSCLLDYDTVAGADKFGNITVVSGLFNWVTFYISSVHKSIKLYCFLWHLLRLVH